MPQSIPVSQGFIGLPGVRLAYDISGRGASAIFVHGGLLDRRMWDEQFWFFARHYQTVRYDMRGLGLSETASSTEPYTHHDDLSEFLKGLQIQPVSLVGFSNYATALEFAIAYPRPGPEARDRFARVTRV
jgi:3-oxoadipate enol-lactonase